MAAINPEAFRCGSVQAAVFFTELQYSAPKTLAKMLDAYADVLDGNPVALPIPEDAPPEIPRLILLSKDQTLRVDLSLQRIDVRWQRQTPDGDCAIQQFIDFAGNVFQTFCETVNALPGRTALILNRFSENDQPAKTLARHFCRPELLSAEPKGPLNRPENFELHAHKTYRLGEFDINSWVRCKTGFLSVGDSRARIILVEQDLNTLSETAATMRLEVGTVRRFLALAAPEMDSILRVYFADF